MNAECLLAYYERISDAPDADAHMRRFILKLAVRGKLVAQNPHDESASGLLKRITEERDRLVKVGEISRSKSNPTRMVEPTFTLPKSWEWVALGHLVLYDAGTKRHPQTLNQRLWLLELEDIEKNSGRLLIRTTASTRESKSTKSEFRRGDILYGKLRPYLNKVLVADEPGYSTTEIVALRPYLPLCSHYFALSLRRPDFVDYVTRLGRGTKMPRLRTEDANVAPFPLPPVAEQHRIVTKVDELMALCDRLEAARTKRETTRNRLAAASLARLNAPDPDPTTFQNHAAFALENLTAFTTRPDQIKALRQTILNLAIRGMLVEQEPNDEPASKLVKRIAGDRAKFGTIGSPKKSKPLPPIDTTNTPFELPPGWAWVRFPEVGIFGRGKSKHRPRNDPILYSDGKYPFIQTGDVARSKGLVRTYSSLYNEAGLAQSAIWPVGTLCITIAANIADSGILAFDACFPDSVVGLLVHDCFKTAKFFEYFIRTAKGDLQDFAPSTAQKNINLGALTEVLIPLPPLAELHRIVAKVDELMALCDRLEESLATGSDTRGHLLDTILHDALNG